MVWKLLTALALNAFGGTLMHYRLLTIAAFLQLICGCSGSPVNEEFDAQPDRVIERIDQRESRPTWLDESTPFLIDNARVISLGETEIPADQRLDAAYRIAQNNASAAVASAIERKLEFIFQNAEEGTGVDARQVRFIGAEVTRLVTSSLRPGKRYWEKVVSTIGPGRHLVKYRVFATVELPEADFKRAIEEALRRNAGKAGISADFAGKVDQQWERITATDRKPAPEAVKQ